MKKKLEVVAGIILNSKNEVFCTLRPHHKSFGNMWEFPGGKVEKGEKKEGALKRELKEELDIEIEIKEHFIDICKEYEEVIINLTCFLCVGAEDFKFNLKEHSAALWLKKENLNSLVWVPTDYPIVEKLIIGE